MTIKTLSKNQDATIFTVMNPARKIVILRKVRTGELQ